jgi:predicted TIM-barrel fold metal-dependent hydrolase
MCRHLSVLGIAAALVALPLAASARQQPLPVIDMHLHASTANAQGPPPLAVCVNGAGFPARDPQQAWEAIFMAILKQPQCANPVWSPLTDDLLRQQNVDVLKRRNVIGLLGGPPERVQRWRQDAPEQIIPSLALELPRTTVTTASIRDLHSQGHIAALAEVTSQYQGIAADDPAFEPFVAVAEQLDIPVGIHVGTGPPGAPYLGFTRYRARLHSALALEEPLLKHPKLRVFVMHAGWPMIDDLLAVLWVHPQVHVEVGAIVWALPRAEFYRYLQRIVEAGFGPRIMFGSDQMIWPGVIERSIQ